MFQICGALAVFLALVLIPLPAIGSSNAHLHINKAMGSRNAYLHITKAMCSNNAHYSTNFTQVLFQICGALAVFLALVLIALPATIIVTKFSEEYEKSVNKK